MNRLRRQAALALAAAPFVPAACAVLAYGAYRDKDMAMIPQTTYLHLLKNTPFFTALTRPQLRWVIDHSQEWEAQAGAVIASSAKSAPPSADLWILLDGRWRLDVAGKQNAAGNADPGKWFSDRETVHAYQLVSTQKSYVMRISQIDMNEMLMQGFDFGTHLADGKAYYQALL
jgi:hypothetical protein